MFSRSLTTTSKDKRPRSFQEPGATHFNFLFVSYVLNWGVKTQSIAPLKFPAPVLLREHCVRLHALMHKKQDLPQHSSCVFLKKTTLSSPYWRPHPHEVPLQSDGHSAPRCTHLRSELRQFNTTEEPYRCCAEHVCLSNRITPHPIVGGTGSCWVIFLLSFMSILTGRRARNHCGDPNLQRVVWVNYKDGGESAHRYSTRRMATRRQSKERNLVLRTENEWQSQSSEEASFKHGGGKDGTVKEARKRVRRRKTTLYSKNKFGNYSAHWTGRRAVPVKRTNVSRTPTIKFFLHSTRSRDCPRQLLKRRKSSSQESCWGPRKDGPHHNPTQPYLATAHWHLRLTRPRVTRTIAWGTSTNWWCLRLRMLSRVAQETVWKTSGHIWTRLWPFLIASTVKVKIRSKSWPWWKGEQEKRKEHRQDADGKAR